MQLVSPARELTLPAENRYLIAELRPDDKVHEVICADVRTHDTAWDQTANSNARGEFLINAVMDANIAFLNDPVQPTRQEPATGAFFLPDFTIVHATFRDRYDWEPLDTLSSDHCPILITIHLPTEKLRRKDSLSWIGRRGIWPLLQQKLMIS